MLQNLIRDMTRRGRLPAFSLAGAIALGGVVAAAQEASPDTVRPASIHTGSCDAPGDVVAELGGLVVMFDDDGDDDGSGSGAGGPSTPSSTPGSDDDEDDGDDSDDGSGSRGIGTDAYQTSGGGQFAGADDASVVEGSEDSAVGTGLDVLLAEPHVIAVFESDGTSTIIACGAIGGFVSADDDDLAVGLREQNGSGYAGVALLDDDDDDDELDVDVYIAPDAGNN